MKGVGQESVLLTGAESVLDRYIIEELNERNVPLKVIVRNLNSTLKFKTNTSTIIESKVNEPKSFKEHLDGVHTVISTLSNLKDGADFFEVCLGYKNNVQLLEEAQKSDVKKIICIIDTECQLHKNSKVLEEKNTFISHLKESGIDYLLLSANDIFPMTSDYNTNSILQRFFNLV